MMFIKCGWHLQTKQICKKISDNTNNQPTSPWHKKRNKGTAKQIHVSTDTVTPQLYPRTGSVDGQGMSGPILWRFPLNSAWTWKPAWNLSFVSARLVELNLVPVANSCSIHYTTKPRRVFSFHHPFGKSDTNWTRNVGPFNTGKRLRIVAESIMEIILSRRCERDILRNCFVVGKWKVKKYLCWIKGAQLNSGTKKYSNGKQKSNSTKTITSLVFGTCTIIIFSKLTNLDYKESGTRSNSYSWLDRNINILSTPKMLKVETIAAGDLNGIIKKPTLDKQNIA